MKCNAARFEDGEKRQEKECGCYLETKKDKKSDSHLKPPEINNNNNKNDEKNNAALPTSDFSLRMI